MPAKASKKSTPKATPRKVQSAGKNEFRLFKQSRSPYFNVRVMVEGKRRLFSTGETSEKAAKSKARAILADIKSRGFEAAVSLHAKKKLETIGTDPTIKELGELYEGNLRFFDKAPSPETARYYAAMLARIGILAKASRISELTSDAIQKAKVKYLKQADKDGRNRDSVVTTLAAMIRNAAGVFSRQSLEIFRQQGLEIANPFAGVKVRGVKVKSYSPMSRELVAKIWSSTTSLLNGNPDASPPSADDRSGTDFRQPQPAVYALLILELGLGLRRNEADKARWDWIFEAPDGRRYLEVRETADFKTKSRQSRVIPMAGEVWDALKSLKTDEAVFIVPGPAAAKPSKMVQRTYRCLGPHDALVFWLKMLGVTDSKPCHALRKEFGSYVATSFSLFHAQKLLGHSTPAVTSAYYASLTDLPELQPSRMGQAKP